MCKEKILEVKENELYFAKLREGAKIPTKDSENAGYDIYACFDEDFILIEPHETKMIPTGLCSACSEDYVIVLKERGSTGTKGIGQRCGIIDSGYRNEWFVPITNTTDKAIIIAKDVEKFEKNPTCFIQKGSCDMIVYPYTKAICQALLLPVPKMKVKEISAEQLQRIPSKRGMGALGSSGK